MIAAMIAFDKGILLGMMGIADVDLDAQAGTKAHPGSGKITALLDCPRSRESRSRVMHVGRP